MNSNKENNARTIEMPSYINTIRFAEARAKEVKKMIGALAETNGNKLIFQQLPKNMRRRVMSHNIKRLPIKLRESHLKQLKKSGMPIKTKRPSRKYRRKPSNLLSEYNRRQRKIAWLETHIWHAKRFHMIEKWGYKIPYKSCDKTFRTCYRATTKYCLLQDISYYICFEIQGNETLLINGFKRMTSQSTGLTIGARAYLNSQREGSTIFYQTDSYPFNAIGEVKFIWKPTTDNKYRTLWLWIHPSYYLDVLQNIIGIFSMKEVAKINMYQTYKNDKQNLCVVVLKNHFNRFRLTGPLSNIILFNVLKTPDSNNKTDWFDTYLNSDDNRQIFSDQCEFWKKIKDIQSPSQISPRLIVNLIITDPRYNFPQKRTRVRPDCENSEMMNVSGCLKMGKIWDCSLMTLVLDSKMSTSQFLKDRANSLVTDVKAPNTAMALPVMLVQQPGVADSSNLIGYGSGWDIIIPSGWAMPVWLCLIMWGARVGAYRETESIQYEMCKYDLLAPDTKAGRNEDNDTDDKYREKYFRLPPAKRTNYNKFAICSPFKCQWLKLIRNWKSDSNITDFYVMRDRKVLGNIQEIIKTKSNKKLNLLPNISKYLNENCLVPIKLTLLNKGKATRYAVICLPENSDFDKKLSGPIEELQDDPNQKERNKLRKEHKLYLKRLSRKRGRAKKNGKVLPLPVEEVKQFKEKMRALWLPESENVKDSCSRKVIGYVTKGDVSFISGCGQSIGYVPISALNALLQNSQHDKVLVRNTHSRQYRFAKLDIIC